jgi:hypothetical protein
LSKQEKRQNPASKWVPVDAPQVKPLTAEWAALKFLEDWTPRDIELAIRKNVKVNLSPFWPIIEDMVVKAVLGWFRTHRPDLYSVLATEDGVRWLKMNISMLRTPT